MGSDATLDYDVLIVGAGISGLACLHHFQERFPIWRIKVIEAGSGVGGTWYHNRYPGARFDSESMSYGYSWDKELLKEWHWKDTFSAQPDTLEYLERVAEKHDLYKDIQFNTRVKSAHWLERQRFWLLVDESGAQYTSRFFVSCIGVLSAPTPPKITGIETFAGEAFHTAAWPKNVDMSYFAGKRIGVIGTGATGIQTITAVANQSTMKSLTVFQRTPNWSAPLRNEKISKEKMEELVNQYEAVFKTCAETPTGFMHMADPRKSSDVTEAERVELWEKLYAQPGFGKWLGVFSDTYTDREANKLYSEFIASKIRARINDPEVADSLIPKCHGFGTRRVPLESGYFEVYNKPNVHLVDLKKIPITTVKPNGILASDSKMHELDILIYATGFDAITGAFNAIDFHGKRDRPLIALSGTKEGERAIWRDHKPHTYLGAAIPGMPNMFMVLGPHSSFGNIPRSIEHSVLVVQNLLSHCYDHQYTYAEAKKEAAEKWYEHVEKCSEGALVNDVDSWMTGVNSNVKGKTVRSVARYGGGLIEYSRRCELARKQGWKELEFRRATEPAKL